MIAIENLTYCYPRRSQPALQDISLQIKPGQILGLLGPNGAGKTTLLRILSTLILPSQGSVRVCGYDIFREASHVRKLIGLASGGDRSFYFRLTGYQNLEFFGGLLGLHGQPLRTQIEKLLIQVGLFEARDVLFMKYSSGMRRKLALARALLADPPVYLLDEPTSGVDPTSAVELRNMMHNLLYEGKTIILATHNLEEANKLSHQVAILKEGRVIALDSPENLKKILSSHQLRVILTEEQTHRLNGEFTTLVQQLRHLPRISNIAIGNPNLLIQLEEGVSDITPIVELLAESGLHVKSITMDQVTLEDVFIHLTHSGQMGNLVTVA